MEKTRNKSGALSFKPSRTDLDIMTLKKKVSKLEKEMAELKNQINKSEAKQEKCLVMQL